MDSNLFWFSDEQWAKIAPHLPTNQPGPEREDDLRVLSGIMHVLKIGAVGETARRNTVRTRRSTTDFRAGASEASGRRSSSPLRRLPSHRNKRRWIPATSRSTAVPTAGKGGGFSGDWGHERWPQQQDPRDRRRVLPALGVHPHARQYRRLRDGRGMCQPPTRHQRTACR
jgi:transposase